ncbi:hypothetical protein LPTSP3_g19310 [Leptospira kobayashii]|uniref:Uncharacterized protein n=1 Tax=Leptospira kobayashii TaxID=1917830 RepID=A0ABM7UJI8_9LEPT|nr:hypothetical protein LPTSP3_g19310 [Leptospira kobayashii]
MRSSVSSRKQKASKIENEFYKNPGICFRSKQISFDNSMTGRAIVKTRESKLWDQIPPLGTEFYTKDWN